MPDSAADEIIKRADRLKGERGTLESQWGEIAELLSPFRDDFNINRTPGDNRQTKIFDSSPLMAGENLAAGIWGAVTNSAFDWFDLETEEPALNEDHDVSEWLQACARALRGVFSGNGQQFYGQAADFYHDLVSFGTAVFYVEESADWLIRYSCRSLSECYVAENHEGKVDTNYRRFKLTARQAAQQFGMAALGDNIRKALEKNPDQTFEFIHAVMPREDYDPRRRDAKGKAFRSCYVAMADRRVMREGGYEEFPYQVARWSTKSRGVYGDSPAMLALPDTKMLNTMGKVTLTNAIKQIDPPILAHDQLRMRGIRTAPGQIIYGGVDGQGRQLVAPMVTGGNINLGLEIEEQRRTMIREAFMASLLLMTHEGNQTATEYLGKQAERIRMFAPYLGRIQMEFLGPVISRTFAILMRQSREMWARGVPTFLPPPPDLLQRTKLRVRYTSPLDRQQKSAEAVSIERWLEGFLPVAQMVPDQWDIVDTDELQRARAEGYGVPKRIFRSPEETMEQRQQRAAKEQAAALTAAAPPLAKAAADGAKAMETMGNMGGAAA